MTLYAIIRILQQIALLQPNVRTSSCGSLFEYMNTNPSIDYNVVHITQTSHRLEEDVDYYGLNIFYISRLDDTLENNRLLIQSTGKEVLTNIIKTFAEEYGVVDYPTMIFTPFSQRFQDECAGVYVSVELGIPIDYICPEDDYGEIGEVIPDKDVKLQSKKITIKNNGTTIVKADLGYEGLSKVTVEVDVEGGEARLYDLTATTNSTYTPAEGFQGFGRVVVDVPGGSSANLGSLSVNEEGEFHQTYNAQDRGLDGFSSVTVNVLCDDCDCSTAYTQGYQEGVADQKDKLTSVNITRNGQYTRGDGYSAITVNVAGDCSSAYTQGFNDAKSEMTAITFTQNGTYMSDSGYSAVTVNVSSGAPEETTIITYHPVSGTNRALQLNEYIEFYDVNGVQRSVISNLYDSTTNTGTITISGKINKIEGTLFSELEYQGDQKYLETINLPNSITEIGTRVFFRAENLTDIVYPSNLISIGDAAFEECPKYTNIVLPQSCKYVGISAFRIDTEHGTNNWYRTLSLYDSTVLDKRSFGGSNAYYTNIYLRFADTGASAYEKYLNTPTIIYDDLWYNTSSRPANYPNMNTFNKYRTTIHTNISQLVLNSAWSNTFPNCNIVYDL